MEAAKIKIIMAKKRKEAVIIIENARYKQLHLRELRVLRSYLLRLPYECRGVYFKFIEVKKSSHQLMSQYYNFIGANNEMAQALNLRYV